LQAEILRLQSELRKTIVFVTHDIDEAIKLGDAVAVFGVGGALQQYDSPSRLLSNPANDFVAEFIGADRGYRLLQFFSATTLDLRPIPTVTEGEIDGLMLAPDEWRLVTTDSGTPFGWIDAAGVERHSQGGPLYDSLTAGGSLFHPDGTLRSALDAALSSPSGIGVAVDGGGVVVGGTAADDVVDAMESQRQESQRQDSQRQESRGREAPEEAAEEQAAGEDVEPAELAVADEEPEPAESAAEEEPAQSADEEPEPAEMSAEAEADDVADADDEPELAEIVTEDEPELTADEDPQPAEKD
jgi:ABC-type proline/glycine betaine transport system ATPase subunit